MARTSNLFYTPSPYEDSVVVVKKKTANDILLDSLGVGQKEIENMNAYVAQKKDNGQTAKTDTKPSSKKEDPFLEGFDDPYGEKREQERQRKEQERKERLAKIRENADKRTWSSQNTTDLFLDGFNGTSNEQRVKFPNTQIQAAPKNDAFLDGFNGIRKPVKGISAGMLTDPLGSTPYKIIDRYAIYDKYKEMPEYIGKDGTIRLQKPYGRFGISLSDLPEITKKTNEPRVNAVYRLDKPHGNVASAHQNINSYAVEKHNSNQIDNMARLIKQENFLNKLEEKKISNSNFIKESVSLDLDTLNGKVNGNIKYDHKPISKGFLTTLENFDKIAKASKIGGKTLGIAGDVMDVLTVGAAISKDIKDDDNEIEKETISTTARVIGETTGATLGAKGGAAVGAWLFGAVAGVASGGLLAAPAAALGGVIGGFLGGIAGSYLGGWAGEELVDVAWQE